jgi:hypothetical protein
MVFNVTFNNISVILWRSDLLVEETGNVSEWGDMAKRVGLVQSGPHHHHLLTMIWLKNC